MNRVPHLATLLLGCLGLSGCSFADQPAPVNWAAQLARADHVLGSGVAQQRRLVEDPSMILTGDRAARHRFMDQQHTALNARAEARARRVVDAAHASAVLGFLRSDAGRAITAAEARVLAGYAWQGDDFPTRAATRFADRTKVGEAARAEFVAALKNRADSVSPLLLSLTVGALSIAPEQADALRSFLASAAGKHWLAARLRAWPEAQQDYLSFRTAAEKGGFLRDEMAGGLGELILPGASGKAGGK